MNPLEKYSMDDLLTSPPAAEPPKDLLHKIQSEIPEPLKSVPDLDLSDPDESDQDAARTPAWRPYRWLIAAGVVTALGGSFLSRQLQRQQPPTQLSEASETVALRRDSQATDATNSPPTRSAAKAGDGTRRLANPMPDKDSSGELDSADGGQNRELRQPPSQAGEQEPSVSPSLRKAAPSPREKKEKESLESNLRALGDVGADRENLRQQKPMAPARLSVAAPATDNTIQDMVMEIPIPEPGPTTGLGNKAKARRVAEKAIAIAGAQSFPASTGGSAEPNTQPYGDVFYRDYGVNPFIDTEDDHLSTFGLDVDTASYTLARRYLMDGHWPPREALRVEEMINYFDYGDAAPKNGDFALHAEGAPSPFGKGKGYYLLRFNIRARDVDAADRRPADLTFVVDTSGSMQREDRLGLVKKALGLLLGQLRDDDRVALVAYGSRGQVVLQPTSDRGAIQRALNALQAGGSTNAEEGLRLAYELAANQGRKGAINRVILCSDGVANVGATGPESILRRIRDFARQGVELTTVGFGMGNYNDVLMEQLADQGNGRYAYVDDLEEARRIFVENLTGTLQTVAAEARVQVSFNPERVSRYRLLGYENRDIADQRFRDDTVDAGEIGAGHTVTALYEVKLRRAPRKRDSIATLHLRYGSVDQGKMMELARTVSGADFAKSWHQASPALRLTSLVAELGEILKGGYWAKEGDPREVLRRAQEVSVAFPGDTDVVDFVSLAGRVTRLWPERHRP